MKWKRNQKSVISHQRLKKVNKDKMKRKSEIGSQKSEVSYQ